MSKSTIDYLIKSIGGDNILHATFVNWEVEKKLGSFVQKLPGLVAGAALGGAGGEMLFGGTLMQKGKAIYGGELGLLIVTENNIFLAHTTSTFEDETGSIGPAQIQLLKSAYDSEKFKLKVFEIKHSQVSIEKIPFDRPKLLESGARLIIKNTEHSVNCGRTRLLMAPVPLEQSSFKKILTSLEGMGTLCSPEQLAECLTNNENPLLEHHIADVVENKKYLREVISFIYLHRKTREAASLSQLESRVKDALVVRFRARADSYGIITFFMYFTTALTLGSILGSIFVNDGDLKTLFIITSIVAGIAAIVFLRRQAHVIWCREYLESNRLI